MAKLDKGVAKFIANVLGSEVVGIEKANDKGEEFIKLKIFRGFDGGNEIGNAFSEESLDEMIGSYKKHSVRGILGTEAIRMDTITRRIDILEVKALMQALKENKKQQAKLDSANKANDKDD